MAFRRRYAGGHQLLCKIIRDGTTRTDNTKRELLFPVGGLEGEGTDGLSYPRFRNRRKFDHVRCARPENGARTIKHKHGAAGDLDRRELLLTEKQSPSGESSELRLKRMRGAVDSQLKTNESRLGRNPNGWNLRISGAAHDGFVGNKAVRG